MKKVLLLTLLLASFAAYTQSTTQIIDSLLLNTEYSKALAYIEIALRDKNNNAFVLENKKAEVFIYLGQFEKAEEVLKNIVAFDGITLTNYGMLYLNQGRNDLALESLKMAITLFEKEGHTNSLDIAKALSLLGLVYKSTGKNVLAEEHLLMALNVRQKQLPDHHELIAASYNDLGLVYSQENNDKALDYYEKALKIYETLHGKDHPKIAIASINIGIIYREMELYGDAINNFENALKIWKSAYTQAHPSKAFALFNLGATYSKMSNFKAAQEYYVQSLKMYQECYTNKHPEIATVLNALGNLELSNREYNTALNYAQQALIANVSDFHETDINHNPALDNYYHGNVLLHSLLLKAQAFEARHYGKTLKFSDLLSSLEILLRCDSLIDVLRHQSTNETDKIGLGVIASEIYANGVRIAYETSQIALKKKSYLELSFYFAEKSKSTVLLESISDANAKSFAGIPTDLLEEEKKLKSAIAINAQKLAQKPSSGEEKILREASFKLNRDYEKFTKKLEKAFPQYYNLKFNTSAPSITQLQRLLNNKTALLSYFIDDNSNRLYIFVITTNKFHLIDRALPTDFNKYLVGLRNSLFFNELKTYTISAKALAGSLLPPLGNAIEDLVIIPTAKLSTVPFETLLTNHSEKNTDFKNLPYLIKRYSVHYEFSAGLLLQKAKDKKEDKPSSIFLCAPVTFDHENLDELPGTEDEVNQIAQLFKSKNVPAATFTRTEANEELIKGDELQKHNLVHFATHGVVDENNPELSRIFLQPTDKKEDGKLFASEIYNLQLNANLVTLSACQTGLGKISKGEGVIGLSRALVYAGAKNIMVSFWSVADQSTADLMKNFYKQVLDNPTTNYSESLRQAKLSLIQSENYNAPYYWAPFILIGH